MKHNIITVLLLLSSTVLSGCIFPFIIGAAAGGALLYDRRTVETRVEDQKIYFQAWKRIREDEELVSRSSITVESFNNIVLLVGQTPTADLRKRAQDIVTRLPGVRRVYNEIAVAPPTSDVARTNDTWMTTKVKSQMLVASGLRSGQIKVVTENSNVYLMGVVTPEQADIAVDVARRVPGVQRVVKIFEYSPT